MPRGPGTVRTSDVFDVGIDETLSYRELLTLGLQNMFGMTGIAVFPAVHGRPSNLAPDQIAYDLCCLRRRHHPLAILVPPTGMFLSPAVPLLAKLLITEPVISGGLTLVVLHTLLWGTPPTDAW
jgi:hypothetical protein